MGCGRTGAFLQLRRSRYQTGHHLPVEVHRRVRPADGADADQARARHLGARRAQRHLPRHQPRVRHATEALRTYWRDDELEKSTKAKGERIAIAFKGLVEAYPEANLVAKGRGLARGLEFATGELAGAVCRPPSNAGC